jgi:hypothetical protein
MSADQGTMCRLREVLFDTLEGVKAGSIDPNRAKAISQLAQTLLNSVQTQIEVRKLELGSKQPFEPGMPLVGSAATRSSRSVGASMLAESAGTPLSDAAKANRVRGL